MKIKVDGVIYNVPDDASVEEIDELTSQIGTIKGIEEAQSILPKAIKAIELPASIAAASGAFMSDIAKGQSPLQFLATKLGLRKEPKEAKPKLSRPEDVSNILKLKGPDTSEYYERAGFDPGASKAMGVATDIVTPLDAINLLGFASKAGKQIGKGIYKYGTAPLGELSSELPEMLYKSNKFGSLGRKAETAFGKMFGQGGLTKGIEDLGEEASSRIGKILATGDEAGAVVDIGKSATKPKITKLAEDLEEVSAISPTLDWVDPAIQAEIARKLNIGEKGLTVANKQKSTLYKLAERNDPKTFEGWLAQASGQVQPGAKNLGKVQKNIALEIRNDIANELDKIKSGLGDDYLKANKDLSNIYNVGDPLKAAKNKGSSFTEYDAALIMRVPQVVLAKKAYSLTRSPRLTTTIGIASKGIDKIITDNPIMKTAFFNPYAYGVRKGLLGNEAMNDIKRIGD